MARVLPLALEPAVLPQLRVRLLLQVCVSAVSQLGCASELCYSVADWNGVQVLNRLPVVFSTSPSPRDLSQ